MEAASFWLEEVSFNAPDIKERTIVVERSYVSQKLADVVKDEDLSRYIL